MKLWKKVKSFFYKDTMSLEYSGNIEYSYYLKDNPKEPIHVNFRVLLFTNKSKTKREFKIVGLDEVKNGTDIFAKIAVNKFLYQHPRYYDIVEWEKGGLVPSFCKTILEQKLSS